MRPLLSASCFSLSQLAPPPSHQQQAAMRDCLSDSAALLHEIPGFIASDAFPLASISMDLSSPYHDFPRNHENNWVPGDEKGKPFFPRGRLL
jgi:hypothetical protein